MMMVIVVIIAFDGCHGGGGGTDSGGGPSDTPLQGLSHRGGNEIGIIGPNRNLFSFQ